MLVSYNGNMINPDERFYGPPRLVAHIGPKQYCLLATDDRNCVDPAP